MSSEPYMSIVYGISLQEANAPDDYADVFDELIVHKLGSCETEHVHNRCCPKDCAFETDPCVETEIHAKAQTLQLILNEDNTFISDADDYMEYYGLCADFESQNILFIDSRRFPKGLQNYDEHCIRLYSSPKLFFNVSKDIPVADPEWDIDLLAFCKLMGIENPPKPSWLIVLGAS